MTVYDLPTAGAASPDIAARIHEWWVDAAQKAGLDLSAFRPNSSFAERAGWAASVGLILAAILSRFSTKMQSSTDAQVRECVEWAARNGMYPPPELVCVDEAVTGKKSDRAGLNRVKEILQGKLAKVLLVYKLSRLFRVAHLGYSFFEDYLVEEGLRGVSVTQNVDTADEKTWKLLASVHGLADDMLLTAIADHVRSELKDLFADGFTTGALTVGYVPVPVPGGKPTKLGRPRTIPGVDRDTAVMIREHFEMIRAGMALTEGWRRWVRAKGPFDRRSRLKYMSYRAYRRMLSNPRYTGLWAFGRKKNVWSNRKDYCRQVDRPETEVTIVRCEELRIVSDELFSSVQARLALLAIGPRGPKRKKEVKLWDMVTDCFMCPHCRVRFYVSGANGKGMRCKRAGLCPASSTVRREDAVRAICDKLGQLLSADGSLVDRVVARAEQVDAAGGDEAADRIATLERRQTVLKNKVDDLTEMAGEGEEADRAAIKARVRAARAELAQVRAELAAAQGPVGKRTRLSAEELRSALSDLATLLADGASGHLGADAVYRAAAAFRLMVGGRVWVHVEPRPGRKRSTARGVFRPELLRPLAAADPAADSDADVEVWLRPPPRVDLLAERVHHLIDDLGQSYRQAEATLRAEGFAVNSANVWTAHRRYYAMRGEAVPNRPYNNGRPRRRTG